jgi:DNA-binding response OmpR family regulator
MEAGGDMAEGRKVLVIDDDQMIRKLLFDLLTFYEFAVYVAYDGISAADLIENIPFDIVITDYDMPGRSGVELARIIRSAHPHSLIIGISGDWRGKDFLEAGADAFFQKPFWINDLLSVIGRK